MERRTVFGYRISDFIGIMLMLIPFGISIFWSTRYGFLGIKEMNITPTLQSAAIASVFYLALIIRTNLFIKDTLGKTTISVIRAVINIWVLSSLFEICIPECRLIDKTALITIAFAWLGMKTVAGYGWAIFLIAGAGNIVDTSNAMGWIGAVYIIAIAVSLFLQVYSLSSIRDLWNDFSNKSGKHRKIIREDIEVAGKNAGKNARRIASKVEDINEKGRL